jgi:stage II sporulation protein GA (sporulation sigma-E factor processing peptidase)
LYLEIYPDIIFVLNFSMDFILLFILSKVNRKIFRWKRMVVGSAVGAVSAVIVSIFPWMNIIIRFLFMNIAASALMLCITFGKMRPVQLLQQMIALYLITYFAGGLINSVYYYTDFREKLIHIGTSLILSNLSWETVIAILLLLIPTSFILLRLIRRNLSERKEIYEVELFCDNRNIKTVGLLDTGNCLYDPIFKKPVMVIDETLLGELLSSEACNDMEAVRKGLRGISESSDNLAVSMENARRLRFIPYQSIGKESGIMPGLILDKVLIHTGKETICNEKVTAAICDNHLSANDDYHVILHKELI